MATKREVLHIMKLYVSIAIFALMSGMVMVSANDLAFYSGPTNPGWISDKAVAENVKVIKDDLASRHCLTESFQR